MGIDLTGIQNMNTAMTSEPGITQVKRGNEISLNLSKGVTLDLTKTAPSLKKVDVGLGWDVSKNKPLDLDVFAFALHNGKILDNSDVIYFNQQDTGKSIVLSGDNRTGAGDGDDEVIHIDLDSVPQDITSILLFANIYDAEKRSQNFGLVEQSYIRLVNRETNKEECIYKLDEEGGLYNAFKFAELVRNERGWSFKTLGEGTYGDVSTLANQYV